MQKLSQNKFVAVLQHPKTPVYVWLSLAFIAALLELLRHSINNYLIYKGVFTHTLTQQNLFLPYPELYGDTNHYGPFFSIIIAPFAIMPNAIGILLWALVNAWLLLKAIKLLPLANNQKSAILWIVALEMMTSTHNLQINPLITALIILSYVMVKRKQDFWAALFIAIGFYIKLYGIVALVFWLFSEHKIKFIGSFIFWMGILFVLPMVISSPPFIIQSYQDWFNSLVAKNIENISAEVGGGMQDISVMGIVKRIFDLPYLSTLYFLVPGLLIYGLALLRFKQYKTVNFQLGVLASTLLFLVLFSTSSESPTYVIAVTGAAIWYVIQPKPKGIWVNVLLIFMLVLTCACTTDLCPGYIRQHVIKAYALKALPCFFVWMYLSFQLLTVNYVNQKNY